MGVKKRQPKGNEKNQKKNQTKKQKKNQTTQGILNKKIKKKENTNTLKLPISANGNIDFQEAKARFTVIFTKSNKAPLLVGVADPLKSDKLTNETFFGKGVNSTLKDLRKMGLNAPKNARALYEMTDPDSQCIKCIGKPTANIPCYICKLKMKNLENSGFYYNKDEKKSGFLWTGRQCEHIIPVLMMAIICGLCDYKGGKKPISPEKSINRYFNKLIKAYPTEKIKIEKLMKEYAKWQSECWKLSYAWSHTECNMIKNEYPFLQFSIQLTDNTKPSIKVKDDIFEENLENLLKMLLSKKDNIWCDMFRAVYRGDINSILNKKSVNRQEQVEEWISTTIEKVKKENLNPLIKHITQKPGFFNISLSILKDTVCESIEGDKEAIKKILGEETLIAQLFHISEKTLINKIRNQGGGGLKTIPEVDMIDSKDNEIIELANILVNLSNVSEQKLERTTTIDGANALMILKSSQPKNTTKMSNTEIKRLVSDIFEDKETSEIIAGAVYLMYMNNSGNKNNPYKNALDEVNQWMNGKGGEHETKFNSLIKRIKAVYGEIIIKDLLITSPQKTITQLPLITRSVIDVLKDIDNLNDPATKEKTTIICGVDTSVNQEQYEKFLEQADAASVERGDFVTRSSSYTLTEIFEGINNILPEELKMKGKKKKKKKKKNTKRKNKKNNSQNMMR